MICRNIAAHSVQGRPLDLRVRDFARTGCASKRQETRKPRTPLGGSWGAELGQSVGFFCGSPRTMSEGQHRKRARASESKRRTPLGGSWGERSWGSPSAFVRLPPDDEERPHRKRASASESKGPRAEDLETPRLKAPPSPAGAVIAETTASVCTRDCARSGCCKSRGCAPLPSEALWTSRR